MTSEKPRRRWFRPRYSLATLFVVVTVVGCWLGYSLNWINQRREFLEREGVFRTDQAFYRLATFEPNMELGNAPGLLWLFGEQGWAMLMVDADDATAARSLFPEAEIVARADEERE